MNDNLLHYQRPLAMLLAAAPRLVPVLRWLGESARRHLAMIDKQVRTRLGDLSKRLGDSHWIDGEFSAADILHGVPYRQGLARDAGKKP